MIITRIFLFCFLLSLLGCSEEHGSTADESYSLSAIDSSDTALMMSESKSILDSDPTDSSSLAFLADYYFRSEQPKKALIYLEKLSKHHSNKRTDSLLLQTYIQMNSFEEAIEFLNKKESTIDVSAFQKAQWLQNAGRNEESNVLLDSLIKIEPENPNLLVLKAINYIALEDTSAACVYFEKSMLLGEKLNDSLIQTICPQISTNTE